MKKYSPKKASHSSEIFNKGFQINPEKGLNCENQKFLTLKIHSKIEIKISIFIFTPPKIIYFSSHRFFKSFFFRFFFFEVTINHNIEIASLYDLSEQIQNSRKINKNTQKIKNRPPRHCKICQHKSPNTLLQTQRSLKFKIITWNIKGIRNVYLPIHPNKNKEE